MTTKIQQQTLTSWKYKPPFASPKYLQTTKRWFGSFSSSVNFSGLQKTWKVTNTYWPSLTAATLQQPSIGISTVESKPKSENELQLAAKNYSSNNISKIY
ncbi:21284_t:CDS:2 [Dentiscutata erythropus]|uniref:21284_t:CDS:1 n=1 Tax=Dentiscutata erythropus TaxID=1348616 RepID=A0A9N8ZZ22_9GLOM|nr:21284_t:CDS:2 [Dentiscutata erythropus]